MMARRVPDTFTKDLFTDYAPTPVVDRFEAEDVKAWTLAGKLAKALSLSLSEDSRDRTTIAQEMSAFLGDEISKAMLDKYAGQSAEHQISAVRLIALTIVTGDARPLNTLLAEGGLIVVPAKYEALLRRERARELRERMEREEAAADAAWKASR